MPNTFETPMPSLVERYWSQFVTSRPQPGEPPAYYEVFSFGSTPGSATAIARLVLDGVKTATGELLWTYEAAGRRPPRSGDLSVVTDGDGYPICVMETTEAEVIPFDEVDARFAYDGGEGDRTLAGWREIYREYTAAECAKLGREPTAGAPLVCERFRVVYQEALRQCRD